MKSLIVLLLPAVALLSACERGGYSSDSVQRYEIRRVEVGLSQHEGKEIATLLIHCADHVFYLTSSDISHPPEIIDRFKQVLPIAANYKAHGESSCELVVTFSQYHSQTISDQSSPLQKDAWFRFKPNTDLCQGFWVTDFVSGQPENFTSVFTQELKIPLIFRETHWIQTKSKSPP